MFDQNNRDLKVLFVSSSGKVFKLLPFIKSQYESLQPYLKRLDHYRISGGGIKAYISAYKELKQKLRTENFDIIHSHWTYSGILCLSLLTREKLIISFMGNDLQGIYTGKFNVLTFKGLINILLSQYLIFKSHGVIVKSKRMLRWIPLRFRYKTEIISNGVNLNKFKLIDQKEARSYLHLETEQKYIAFLADITDPNKNFELLRKADLQLKKANISYKILAPYPIDAGLIPFYLAAANVMAFPSKLEGSPNIIKEAIAMGCPIVATDVGDVKERIENIKGCYISEFNASDFSEKLISALNLSGRINSNSFLEELSEDNIAKRIISFYEKVIQRGRNH